MSKLDAINQDDEINKNDEKNKKREKYSKKNKDERNDKTTKSFDELLKQYELIIVKLNSLMNEYSIDNQ